MSLRVFQGGLESLVIHVIKVISKRTRFNSKRTRFNWGADLSPCSKGLENYSDQKYVLLSYYVYERNIEKL